MRFIRSLIIAACLVAAPAIANAADWYTGENATGAVCTALRQDGVCYVETAGATTSTISVRVCASWAVVVYATGASVMVEACTDSACTSSEPLLATALTGDSPNTFVTSTMPVDFIRLTGGSSVTVSIKCGR